MPSNQIESLIAGTYNALDFKGIRRDGNGDAGRGLEVAMRYLATLSIPSATLILPAGTYRIDAPDIPAFSNIELVGSGPGTLLQLGVNANGHIFRADSVSGFRLRNMKLDGNRTNNLSGNGCGVYLTDCTDCYFENVEVVSCVEDGWFFDQCTRLKLNLCQGSDNGRHGFSLNTVDFCLLMAVAGFNNSRVSASGVGDGINLDILSHDNTIIAPDCYETALTGGRQGYGVREALGGGCYRNLVIGNPQANATGDFLLGPNSLALSPAGIVSGGLGFGTTSPDASALLDMISTTQGHGIPAMTTAQRDNIVSPRAGIVIYNTSTGKLNVRVAAAWEAVTSA